VAPLIYFPCTWVLLLLLIKIIIHKKNYTTCLPFISVYGQIVHHSIGHEVYLLYSTSIFVAFSQSSRASNLNQNRPHWWSHRFLLRQQRILNKFLSSSSFRLTSLSYILICIYHFFLLSLIHLSIRHISRCNFFLMNNNLLEEAKFQHTKSIQDEQPPY
jgi:hypothetical protein